MSSNMCTETIISLINRFEDKYPYDHPTATRMGYAVGLVGWVALTVPGEFMAQEVYDAIRDYSATLRQERALAETDELSTKLLSREFICYDMLDVVSEFDFSHIASKANKGIVSNNDVIVNKENEVVDNKNDFVHVGEGNDFILISEVESDASNSEADSSEWELV